jgi:hypothetical protein
MPFQVTLKPQTEFLGSADLYSELLRRLSDGPTSIAELVDVDGCSAVILESMLNGLPRRYRGSRTLDLEAIIEINSPTTIGGRMY